MNTEVETEEEVVTSIYKKPEDTGGEEIPGKNTGDREDLEEDFASFAKSKSTHEIPKEEREKEAEFFPDESDINASDAFKLQVFTGVFFLLIDGIHVFLFNLMTKYKVKKEDIALDDDDREGLNVYFRTKRIIAFINKLPQELIGLVHMEYLYINKFNDHIKKLEAENKEEEPEEEEQEEPEEETQEQKLQRLDEITARLKKRNALLKKEEPVKRSPAKRKKKKRKPVKKSAVRKEPEVIVK